MKNDPEFLFDGNVAGPDAVCRRRILGTKCAAASLDNSSSKHKPTLAVTVAVQQTSDLYPENLEDLLMVEMANQSFLQLVDRQAIHAVIKEHAIALSNLHNADSVLALGRFAGRITCCTFWRERKPRRSAWSRWPAAR